jgi:septal ring factor EnvC (AmiA/AmiB activator)
VVYVGNQLRGYGNLIMIKHGEDYISAYAHNDTMMVNNGQNVKAGQKIATMGSSDADSVRCISRFATGRRPSIRSAIYRRRAVNRSAKRLFYRQLA